jgi:predicted transcriptional regulator
MINKELNVGNGVILRFRINDNIALMTSNYNKELLKIYYKIKEQGKDVEFNYRANVIIEHYKNKTAEQIDKMLDHDYKIGMDKQKEVIENGKKSK